MIGFMNGEIYVMGGQIYNGSRSLPTNSTEKSSIIPTSMPTQSPTPKPTDVFQELTEHDWIYIILGIAGCFVCVVLVFFSLRFVCFVVCFVLFCVVLICCFVARVIYLFVCTFCFYQSKC